MRVLRRWFRLRWLAVAVGAFVVVFWLTHIPQQNVPEQLQMASLDKILHVAAYGLLTILALKSLYSPGRLLCAGLLVILTLLSGLDEYTQGLVGRTASVGDWLADLVGIGLVLMAYLGYRASFLKC